MICFVIFCSNVESYFANVYQVSVHREKKVWYFTNEKRSDKSFKILEIFHSQKSFDCIYYTYCGIADCSGSSTSEEHQMVCGAISYTTLQATNTDLLSLNTEVETPKFGKWMSFQLDSNMCFEL